MVVRKRLFAVYHRVRFVLRSGLFKGRRMRMFIKYVREPYYEERDQHCGRGF